MFQISKIGEAQLGDDPSVAPEELYDILLSRAELVALLAALSTRRSGRVVTSHIQKAVLDQLVKSGAKSLPQDVETAIKGAQLDTAETINMVLASAGLPLQMEVVSREEAEARIAEEAEAVQKLALDSEAASNATLH